MMFRSPHKRGRRRPMRPLEYKTTVSGNKAGRGMKSSGARVTVYPVPPMRRLRGERSRHIVVNCVPTGMPGTPNGKCLGAGHEAKCSCGKHNRGVK